VSRRHWEYRPPRKYVPAPARCRVSLKPAPSSSRTRSGIRSRSGSPGDGRCGRRCIAASFLKIPTRRCGANVSMSAQRLRKHKRPRNVSWERAIDMAGTIAPHSRCCRSARCAIAVADRVRRVFDLGRRAQSSTDECRTRHMYAGGYVGSAKRRNMSGGVGAYPAWPVRVREGVVFSRRISKLCRASRV
jgi:hypothetical protein